MTDILAAMGPDCSPHSVRSRAAHEKDLAMGRNIRGLLFVGQRQREATDAPPTGA